MDRRRGEPEPPRRGSPRQRLLRADRLRYPFRWHGESGRDANASSCATCLVVAFRAAGENCPNNTGVIMYEDDCVLRFANRQFLDFLDAEQWQAGELRTVPSVAAAWFSAAATAILTAVSGRASSNSTAGNAKKYFTTGEVDFNPRIYVLAQCAGLDADAVQRLPRGTPC
ncbi:hypothetical protein ACQ4PT_004835 [Festuca glaucescens]